MMYGGQLFCTLSSVVRSVHKSISFSRVLQVIEHDVQTRRFNMRLPSDTAYVEYFPSNGFVNLHHIFVPKRYRALGIGQDLAREVMEHCADNNIKVILSCPYLVVFYRQHPYPQFKKIVKGVVTLKDPKP